MKNHTCIDRDNSPHEPFDTSNSVSMYMACGCESCDNLLQSMHLHYCNISVAKTFSAKFSIEFLCSSGSIW